MKGLTSTHNNSTVPSVSLIGREAGTNLILYHMILVIASTKRTKSNLQTTHQLTSLVPIVCQLGITKYTKRVVNTKITSPQFKAFRPHNLSPPNRMAGMKIPLIKIHDDPKARPPIISLLLDPARSIKKKIAYRNNVIRQIRG
jgi:hypothetical protein